MKKLLIIGGNALGASAAAKMARYSSDFEITILEKNEHISFSNCAMPYYVGGVLEKESEFIFNDVESFAKRNIKVFINTKVIKIIPNENKVIALKNKKEVIYDYDYLIYGAGGSPIIPEIKNLESEENKSFLLNPSQAIKLKKEIKDKNNILVIGGGFIGIEVVENIKNDKNNVTLIEYSNQVLGFMDHEMTKVANQVLIEHKVDLKLNSKIDKIDIKNKIAILNNQEKIKYDYIILAIGVVPNIKPLKDSQIKIGSLNGVEVNEFLQTNFDNVFAGGDAIQVINKITKKSAKIPLAWPANRHADIIVNNILEKDKIKYKGSLGTSIIKLYNYSFAISGVSEKVAIMNKLDYNIFYGEYNTRAGTYPKNKKYYVKLLLTKDYKYVIGAQAYGQEKIDKIIDKFALIIDQKVLTENFEDLQFAYAPPFNSSKDAINLIGSEIAKLKKGTYKYVSKNSNIDNDKIVNIDNLDNLKDLNENHILYSDNLRKSTSIAEKISKKTNKTINVLIKE